MVASWACLAREAEAVGAVAGAQHETAVAETAALSRIIARLIELDAYGLVLVAIAVSFMMLLLLGHTAVFGPGSSLEFADARAALFVVGALGLLAATSEVLAPALRTAAGVGGGPTGDAERTGEKSCDPATARGGQRQATSDAIE